MARERSRLIAQMDALESEVLELTSARRAAAGTRLSVEASDTVHIDIEQMAEKFRSIVKLIRPGLSDEVLKGDVSESKQCLTFTVNEEWKIPALYDKYVYKELNIPIPTGYIKSGYLQLFSSGRHTTASEGNNISFDGPYIRLYDDRKNRQESMLFKTLSELENFIYDIFSVKDRPLTDEEMREWADTYKYN